PFQSLPVGPVGEFGDLVTADFNGDGFSDLVKSSPQSPDVLVYLGLGDGTFRQQQPILKGGDFNTSLAEGDFNGDGRLDLAIGHRFDPVVTVVPSPRPRTTVTTGSVRSRGRGRCRRHGRLQRRRFPRP